MTDNITEPQSGGKKFGLNGTAIKIIAIVLMVFDHIHQMFALGGAPIWLTWLGRPVFILFLFMSAESFYHTGNKKKYLIRLLVAAWIMVATSAVLQLLLPFPVAETGETVALMNGAFMTFFVAGLYMLFWDILVDGVKTKKTGKVITAVLLFFVPVLTVLPTLVLSGMMGEIPFGILYPLMMISSALPCVLLVEGGPMYVLLALVFYVFKKRRMVQVGALAVMSVIYFMMYNDATNPWLMIAAAVPMLLYNGEKGRGMKWFFYVFYPAHIYLLYIIARFTLNPQ
jgi:hypothetical protein